MSSGCTLVDVVANVVLENIMVDEKGLEVVCVSVGYIGESDAELLGKTPLLIMTLNNISSSGTS